MYLRGVFPGYVLAKYISKERIIQLIPKRNWVDKDGV